MKGDGRRRYWLVDDGDGSKIEVLPVPQQRTDHPDMGQPPTPVKKRRASAAAVVIRRKPGAKVRPCLRCSRPRWSTSPSDRLHPKCRPAGELNDGEAAGLVR